MVPVKALHSAETLLAPMTIFTRRFRAATTASLLFVLSGSVCANILFPSNTVDVHFEVLGTGLPEQERNRLLHAADVFKNNSVAANICAFLMADSDGYDGPAGAQMSLSFQRAQTVTDLLKTIGIHSTMYDVVHTAKEQQWPPRRWTLPIRVSNARVAVTFSPCPSNDPSPEEKAAAQPKPSWRSWRFVNP
jgi:hypothetical protein